MSSGVVIALISLVGTIFGSLIGSLSASKMINYRLDLLEERMKKLENLIERVSLVELKVSHLDEYMKENCE